MNTTPNPHNLWPGRVLDNVERNGHDDSDFFVLVWNDEEGRIDRHEIGSTRYAGGIYFIAPDASPEVRAKAAAWQAACDARAAEARAARKTLEVGEGKLVRFLGTGRTQGYKAGDVGDCLRCEPSPFRTYYRDGYNRREANLRALVRLLDGRQVWVDAKRVEVVHPERARLEQLAKGDISDLLASRGVPIV